MSLLNLQLSVLHSGWWPASSSDAPVSAPLLPFYVGAGDANSGTHACAASAFTHWASSPVLVSVEVKIQVCVREYFIFLGHLKFLFLPKEQFIFALSLLCTCSRFLTCSFLHARQELCHWATSLALHLLSVFDSCFCSPFELLARIFLARFSPILLDEMSSFIVFFPNGCATSEWTILSKYCLICFVVYFPRQGHLV